MSCFHIMEQDMLYIGIDLGTPAVKLLLMKGNGEIVKIATKEYPLYFPKPGWSEQNPEDWFVKTMEGLGELIKDCDRSEIAGIRFGGQMHGLVVLDEKDEVIRPAILWNDGRTAKETVFLNEVTGKDQNLRRRCEKPSLKENGGGHSEFKSRGACR